MKHHLSIDLETFSSVPIESLGPTSMCKARTLRFFCSHTASMIALWRL